MPLLSVIVLCRDRRADTRRCLMALRRHTPGPLEVLAYDNASSPPAAAGLRRLARSWPALRLVRNAANVPFAKAVNAGMRAARGELLCWLNNDAVVGPGWRRGLAAALEADPAAAAAGPLTGAMAPPAQVAARAGTGAAPTPFLGGFCLMLRRSAVEAVGFLDERFVWGWEDMDYCLRLRQAGRRLLLARGVFVRHAGGRTMGLLPAALRRRTDSANRRLFLSKWLHREPWRSDALELFERTGAPWDRWRPEVTAVIPLGPRPDAARPCLRALERAARTRRVEVLLAGPAREAERLARTTGLPAGWVAVPREASAPRAVNAALREALGDRILLLDPRARLSERAVDVLCDAAAAADGQAAVGPHSRLTHLRSQTRPGPAAEAPYLRGGCILIGRRALEGVGTLDERLLWGDAQADLCLRLRQAGGRVIVAKGASAGGPPEPPDGAPGPAGRLSTRVMFEKWGAQPPARRKGA